MMVTMRVTVTVKVTNINTTTDAPKDPKLDRTRPERNTTPNASN